MGGPHLADLLLQGDEGLRPGPLNVHRLLLTGVLLAAKLMDDHYYNNAYYAKVGLQRVCFAAHCRWQCPPVLCPHVSAPQPSGCQATAASMQLMEPKRHLLISLQIGGVALEELNSLELTMMQQLGWQLRVGALPITQTLAHVNATADGPDAELATRFRPLLRPAAVAAIRATAAMQPPLKMAPAWSEGHTTAGSVDSRAAAVAYPEQQRRSSLDCRVAACVMPFASSGIAAH
jgi:Cyclin